MKKIILAATVFLAILTGGVLQGDTVKFVTYGEHGAVGDGITDDFEAIIKAHAAANEAGLPVKADAGKTYYIGDVRGTAVIQTDTDWTDARFIIDDSKVTVENRSHHIFRISSKLPSSRITTIASLKKSQPKLDMSLPQAALIDVTDNTTRRFIRFGANQNSGSVQSDIFVVDKDGNVDISTPIIWDFDTVSSMTAYPIDPETLTVKGGHFTRIANQAESRYTYYARGISITRSNVAVDGIYHVITGEGEHGAPYGGFITVSRCTNVLIQNSIFSGHKTYVTIGSAGTPVSMGTYDLDVNRANNVTFKNCKQTNSIHDNTYWGIFGSNFSKNLTFDTVEFSRFDAHQGVTNATIKNSVLGHQGINLIGHGTFLLENTKVTGGNLINLRSDYGSTFEGEVIIRNSEFLPRNGVQSDAVLIGGNNSGQHNFGYTCYMPRKITIEGLIINDANHSNNYQGPKIFANFNNANRSEDYVQPFPYVLTEEVIIKDLTIKSGKLLITSTNPFMFRNVKVTVLR